MSQEYQPLLECHQPFRLYCEVEEIWKEISLLDRGVSFPMRGETVVLPYNALTEVKCYKMWPLLCKHEDIIYLHASPHQVWFSGKHSQALETAVREKMTANEILK